MGPLPYVRRPATATGNMRNPQPAPTRPTGTAQTTTPNVRAAGRPSPIVHNLHRPRLTSAPRTPQSAVASRPTSNRPSQSNSMTSSLALDDAPSYSLRTDLPIAAADNTIAASIVGPPNLRSTVLSDTRARLIRQVQVARRKPPTSAIAENAFRRNRQSLSSIRRRISNAIQTTDTASNASSSDVPATPPPTAPPPQVAPALTSLAITPSRSRNAGRSATLRSYIPFSRDHSSSSRSRSPRRPSSSTLNRRINRIKPRIGSKSNMVNLNPMQRVTNNEKSLTKIFRYFNWNELLPLRLVSKKWLDTISMEPSTEYRLGVITIRKNWEEAFLVFNESPVIWTKFRFVLNMFVDLVEPTQLAFWSKHGPFMKFLEIRNNSINLSGLVEILSRCPKLEHFLIAWSPQMYSFNSELVKKYYGINFYSGNFENMQELIVEKSNYLTDNALSSLTKWCGGSLRSLTLSYPPEKFQDPLTRLKPRWTLQPLVEYFERFGYTRNLQFLDFSWSNMSSRDLKTLGETEFIGSVKGITLSHCQLDDTSVAHFLEKIGRNLQELRVEDVPITEMAFISSNSHKPIALTKLQNLDISGPSGDYKSLNFLLACPLLDQITARNTQWLDYNSFVRSLKSKQTVKSLKKLDVSGKLRTNGSKQVDPNQSVIWFTSLTSTLGDLTHLNLNGWTSFSKNENFKLICQKMHALKELRLRDWKELTDSGVTGLSEDKLNDKAVLSGGTAISNRTFVGSLKNLEILDLSGTAISDATIKYGILFNPRLRKFGFERTQISDVGLDVMIQYLESVDHIKHEGCDKIVNPENRYRRSDGRFIFVSKF